MQSPLLTTLLLWVLLLTHVCIGEYSENLHIMSRASLLNLHFRFLTSATTTSSSTTSSMMDFGHFPHELLLPFLLSAPATLELMRVDLTYRSGLSLQLFFTQNSSTDIASSAVERETTVRFLNLISAWLCTSFIPSKDLPNALYSSHFSTRDKRVWSAKLPRETICTENLTPWLKLLPCRSHSGLAALLNPYRVFDSRSYSLGLDLKRTASHTETRWELEQWFKVEFDSDPDAPRPLDYLLHQDHHQKQSTIGGGEWSIWRLLDRKMESACPLNVGAAKSWITLGFDGFDGVVKEFQMNGTRYKVGDNKKLKLPKGVSIRDGMVYVDEDASSFAHTLGGYAVQPSTASSRHDSGRTGDGMEVYSYMSGYGDVSGYLGVVVEYKTNSESAKEEMEVVYEEVLPWFLKVWMHTLRLTVISSNNDAKELDRSLKPMEVEYQPSLDRTRPSIIQVRFRVQSGQSVRVSIGYDKKVLRYAEYPPDANRGFDIGPSLIYYRPITKSSIKADGEYKKKRTENRVVTLPTPDFSMPYNVITLTSTVIALFFGGVYHGLTRGFDLKANNKRLVVRVFEKMKRLIIRK